jgi:rhodanese-related sulfurtransferase
MPDWKKSGGMELAEAKGIRKLMADEASFVIVDLRSEKAAKKGHIPGAVNIPAGKLAKAEKKFPKNKKAPIYLYGDGVDVDAFKTVKGWGYKKVSVLNGGFKGWTSGKGKVARGKPADKIVYVKKTPKGQISIDEFKKVVEAQPSDKLILDVRDTSEGTLKGAVQIASEEVGANLDKLPRDKEIIVHCNTGVLASNAREVLEKKGYKVRYLDAVVQVSADGSYEVAEK